jgi:virulence-associated protein VapD
MNYKQALANTNEQLSITQRSLDSMRMAYTDLVKEMEAYRAELRQGSMASIKTIYERDTIYVTQKEVEQRIVEKIVRDTVIIEIPMDGFAPLMTEAEASNSAVQEESDQGKNKKEKRSSIQFNFSESKSFR